MDKQKLTQINTVVEAHFSTQKKEHIVAVKQLMPDFIRAGIFQKDEKNGLPIRKVLRDLDQANALDQIPLLHAERKNKNTYWYFVRKSESYISEAPNDTGLPKKKKAKLKKTENDESYLINQIDDLLEEVSSRQHKFSFILGEYHKDGYTRSPLAVSAYYPDHNLVIELIKPKALLDVDRPNNKTSSGITRGQLQPLYAERKKKGLIGKGVNFIEIEYAAFELNENGTLVRHTSNDLEKLKGMLTSFIKQ